MAHKAKREENKATALTPASSGPNRPLLPFFSFVISLSLSLRRARSRSGPLYLVKVLNAAKVFFRPSRTETLGS